MSFYQLVVIVVILGAIGAVVYFVFLNKPDPSSTAASAGQNSDSNSGSNNSGLDPDVQAAKAAAAAATANQPATASQPTTTTPATSTSSSATLSTGVWIGVYTYPSPPVGGFTMASQAATIASMLGGTLATYDQVYYSGIGFVNTKAGILSGSNVYAATTDGDVCAYSKNSNCNTNGKAVNIGYYSGGYGSGHQGSMNMFVVFTDEAWRKLPTLNVRDRNVTKESIAALIKNAIFDEGGSALKNPTKVDPNKKWITLYVRNASGESTVTRPVAINIAGSLQGTLATWEQIRKSGLIEANLAQDNRYFMSPPYGNGNSTWALDAFYSCISGCYGGKYTADAVITGYNDTGSEAQNLFMLFDDATWQTYLLNPALQKTSLLNNGRFDILKKSAVSFIP